MRRAESLDRVHLRRRRVVGHHDGARHAEVARAPRDALRHVAGARRVHAVLTTTLSGSDRIAFVAPRSLNEPIGWRFSSLR